MNRWQPYGTSAELYSFAIILWQLVSHEVPHAGLSSAAFHRRVIQEGARPPLNKTWPAPLSQLLSECWSPTPSERPAIEEVKTPPDPHTSTLQPGHTLCPPARTPCVPDPEGLSHTTRDMYMCVSRVLRCASDCTRSALGSSREGRERLSSSALLHSLRARCRLGCGRTT